MKSMLLCLLLLTTPAHASWEAFLLGAVLTSGSKKTEKVYLDEFSKNVEVIEKNIQSLLPNPPLTANLLVPKGEEAKYVDYFTNQGFDVTHSTPGQISFSFSKYIQAEQARRAQWEAELAEARAARELWWQENRWWCYLVGGLALFLSSLYVIVQNEPLFGPLFQTMGTLLKQISNLLKKES